MEYRPLGNRIVVDPIEITEEDKKIGNTDLVMADSGIILQKGKVVAVGRGEVAMQTGEIIPMEVKKDDTVLFRKEAPYLPLRMPGEDKELRIMREADIECIL